MRKLLLDALFPKTRQLVLSATLLHPERWWYLSDLAGHLGLSPSSLQRELSSLIETQLLLTRKDGNRLYFKANMSCPGIEDLQNLLIKTAGIADIIKATLKKFLDDSDCAFIYGSLARGEGIASSDVDIMMIGNLKLALMAASVKKLEKVLEREVNITIFSMKEFLQKLSSDDGFLKTVMSDKKIFVKGNELELKSYFKEVDR